MRRFARVALLFAAASAGCAAPRPVVREEGTTRVFSGQRVMGPYVSPSAYSHYMLAQLAALDGRHDVAAQELARATASDGWSPYLRTRLGEELLALGRVDEARDSFETALRADPDFAPAFVGLGHVALAVAPGDKAAAETHFRKALELDRTCEEAYLALASLYRERGDAGKADDVFRQMAGRIPDSAAAHQQLARMAAARGDLKGAVEALRKAVGLAPGNLEARVELGRVLFALHQVSEAERELRLAWERSYRDTRIAELLATVAIAAGKPEEADALLDQLDDGTGTREHRLRTGWLLLERRRPERAESIAAALLAEKSGYDPSPARLLRAAALKALHREPEAETELQRVPPDSLEYPRAQLQVGRILVGDGRLKEAAEQLGRAAQQLAGKPGEDLVAGLLAEVHERSGDRAQARRVLESAMKARPDSDALAYALGGLLDRAGEPDRACDVVQKILDRNPDSAEALNFIGWSYADRGVKLKEAERLLERARALRPSSGQIADSLGWLYYKTDRAADAVRTLEEAERLLPGAPDVLKHLGDAYAKTQDRTRAVAAWKRALAANPDLKIRQAVEERLLHFEEGRVGSR